MTLCYALLAVLIIHYSVDFFAEVSGWSLAFLLVVNLEVNLKATQGTLHNPRPPVLKLHIALIIVLNPKS